MATSKYLTLEEAADRLGMAPEDLVRLRERGVIRGFADHGTWKFPLKAIEEFTHGRDNTDPSLKSPVLNDGPLGLTLIDIAQAEDLSQSDWQQIDEVCDRFEKAWRSRSCPHIEDYLSRVSSDVLRGSCAN